MKQSAKLISFICLILASCPSLSANVWIQNQTLSAVHTLNSGNFVIWFPIIVNDVCQGSGKIMHVYEGQNGVTTTGLQTLLSSSMTALVSKMTVDVKYDDSNSSCFVKEVRLKNE